MSTIKDTISELIAKNILEITKSKSRKNKKQRNISISSQQKTSVSLSITNIIASSEIKESEKEEMQELKLEEVAEEENSGIKGEKEKPGGYGTVKAYAGASPNTSYTNYESIWSHLGVFRSKGAYESPFEKQGLGIDSTNESTGILVSNEVIAKAEKHFKYFVRGEIMGDVGYVPPAGLGIDSKDWEKYRMMTQMSIYRPLLKLIRSFV